MGKGEGGGEDDFVKFRIGRDPQKGAEERLGQQRRSHAAGSTWRFFSRWRRIAVTLGRMAIISSLLQMEQ